MNVFLREVRAYRKSTIIWAASLSALIFVFMGLYPAFTSDVAATRQILSGLPEAVRTALNISLTNFFTIYGFFGYIMGFAVLAGAIQAMNLGTGVVSKEVSGKTADFLLSKPITRTRVMTAKLGAAFVAILFTSGVFSLVSYAVALIVSKTTFAAGPLLLMLLTFFLVQVVFVALGALFAVILPRVKSVVSVTLPTVFAFYIIGTIGDIVGNDKVRYISPFKYYDSNYIISHSSLDTKYFVVEVVVVVVAIALSYLIYLRKDVRASA